VVRDVYTGLAVLAASLALFWMTLGLERHPMLPVGPGFYPRIVLGVTAAFGLGIAIAGLVASRRRGPVAVAVAVPAAAPPNFGLVAAAFGIFAAYILAMPWLGFRVSTFLFLLAMPAALERPRTRRRWLLVAAIALVATVVVYFVFERYLHVLLPRGRWTGF
jgi:putative tricarboxylic transport membrane protein